MSEKIRHTLLHHEVPPPPAAWDYILTELNEMDALKSVGQQLHRAEVIPASQNWNRILSGLEEINIGQQLAAIEQTPPPGTWDKIAHELDASAHAPVKKITPWWRYAAAAAIFVTIGLGIVQLTQSSSRNEETVFELEHTPGNSPAKQDQNKVTLEELVTVAPTENEEARNDAALEASKKTYAKLEYPAKKIAREVSGFYFNSYSGEAGTRGINPAENVIPESKTADRYITLMTPEGNIIRVSKKLGGMVCCISGEAEDPACTDQLKKWREKIVASSLGHSADSFMDLLQLVNAAEENESPRF
jgi:hypothetical protein